MAFITTSKVAYGGRFARLDRVPSARVAAGVCDSIEGGKLAEISKQHQSLIG